MTTPAIVPRWEWRTFGADLGQSGARLAALDPAALPSAPPVPAQASDEVYLLSTLVDSNVKIRDGFLEIKALERTNGDGLEQWRPVLKAGFPIPVSTVVAVFAALGLPPPAVARPTYSLDELIEELIDPEPRLLAIPVHKSRVRYSLPGGVGELTRVTAADRTLWTLAVESDDPASVIAAVRSLGLARTPNLSYPRALKGLAGLAPDGIGGGTADAGTQRVAVIDVGTNSVKLHIGERDGAGRWQRVLDRAEVTRLGEGLQATGEIAPEAQRRTLEAICGMVAESGQMGADPVVALGTMGLRTASNSDAFISAVRERCGVEIEVIDGETEARLAYLAVQAGAGLKDGAVDVFDTGGGSTQVTIGRGGQILAQFSLNLGAARLAEQFGLDRVVSPETLDAALVAIGSELGRLDGEPPPEALVGMGGAVTNLTSVSLGMTHYDPDCVQGAVLTREELDRQIALYAGLDAEGRRAIPGLQPGRAEVILAGALIVRTLMEKRGKDRLSVSDRGLRHGVLIERFSA